MERNKIKAWVSAFRLRTLALSFALIVVGAALALQVGAFDGATFALALVTTLMLQILSNLSNDYGDSVTGVDAQGRKGPERAVQSGAISLSEMRVAMVLFAVLSLLSGCSLLWQCYGRLGFDGIAVLFVIGILCIVAAITYTVGRKPYGYMGLGDLSVFIFFGLVGVAGSNALFVGMPTLSVWLPAVSVGLLSVGVLNMNNLRDHDSDKASGKRTLVVMMGKAWAQRYQVWLVCLSFVSIALYVILFGRFAQLICLVAFVPLFRHLRVVWRHGDDAPVLDSQLKVVSLSTAAMSLLFFVGTLFGCGI